MIVLTQGGAPVEEISTPSAPVERFSFSWSLTGVDGSAWDLTNGPVILMPGTQGLGMPDVEHWWQTSPVIDGSRWKGMRTAQKAVILPVVISADSWDAWRDLDAALFRAVDPSGEALVSVIAPDGVTRSMGLRLTGGGEVDSNPLWDERPFATYALEFAAAQPYWRGDVIQGAYKGGTTAPLFPGPPFNINPSSTFETATVTNPGDVAAWPRYVVTGPCSAFTVGIGDSVVSSSRALTVGQSVTVDTDPAVLNISDQDGNRIWEFMDSREFAAIPARTEVPLTISLTNHDTTNSSATVEFTPLYRRPW